MTATSPAVSCSPKWTRSLSALPAAQAVADLARSARGGARVS